MAKSEKKIAIIGFGYVGKAMDGLYRDHYQMTIYDPMMVGYAPRDYPGYTEAPYFQGKITTTKEDVNKCNVAVICVPTPIGKNGECDTSIVEGEIDWIECPLIIIKSTVEVGTTDRLIEKTGKNIIFCPEYAGESSYYTPAPYDFDKEVKKTPFFIFGGSKENTSKAIDMYMPILGPTKKYIQTDARTAEIVKYMENSFYATKIAFCYEMAGICEASGIDYNEARELWLLDPRINPMHTAVFHENDAPYGGKCLVKDISGLVELAKKNGYEPELLKEVIDSNNRIEILRRQDREDMETGYGFTKN